MRVVISGLTAAGKTTLAKRLAAELHTSCLSGSEAVRKHLGDASDVWTPELDQRRTAREVERAIDLEVLGNFRSARDGVFDAWSLPWLAKDDGERVSIWIESDVESRVRKCMVSYIERGKP